jgi:hypothetical protein
MKKTSPFFTASVASVTFFIILLMLEYMLSINARDIKTLNWQGALLAAISFWIAIFLVHQYLNRKYAD